MDNYSIVWQIYQKWERNRIRDGQRVSLADTHHPLADTRQWVRMAPFLQKPGGYPGIPKDTQGWKVRWPAGRVSFQPARYMYLYGWKENLLYPSTPEKKRKFYRTCVFRAVRSFEAAQDSAASEPLDN
ncbi:uncharacterized protein PGTG_09583 [Puccinia graminis f. sp. tritici CRL 75-36-700-3]|uniref:Uncharacterized protein n=1 Tax=Puccinia graminis f. sp. tritici (strain CRL 75-36-700-3 / race SCCL) TaxID=418459 RepID=E3KHU5_PUCGT|nr:uncharacterized protein PGTG_09583 [Puccinia graminis f. sp. tritici CRL 75-36-700-3]EFP83870.1 hypothetical protein PGTG_09583 [Puccinia graminis f. sp. tritici CRL 75-36-700-3]